MHANASVWRLYVFLAYFRSMKAQAVSAVGYTDNTYNTTVQYLDNTGFVFFMGCVADNIKIT